MPENAMLYVQLSCVRGLQLIWTISGVASAEAVVTKPSVQVSSLSNKDLRPKN